MTAATRSTEISGVGDGGRADPKTFSNGKVLSAAGPAASGFAIATI